MYQTNRKRVNLSLQEKIWIVKKKEENKKISQAKLGLDFSIEFKRPISKQCISKILSQSEEILALAEKNPELETKKAFKLQKLTIGAVVTTLYELIINKFK